MANARFNWSASRLKLVVYLDRWLQDAARPSIRETTYQSYRGIIRNHIKGRIGGVILAKLAPTHIQAMYAEMERQKASARLRQLTHAVLRRALKQAVRWGLLMWNPCDAVQPPRVAQKEMMVLQPEQVVTLLKAAKGDRFEALYILAVATGMRMGEMFGLQWADVDLNRGVLKVSRSLTEVHGKVVVSEPKTAKGRRSITLPAMAVAALREHKARRAAAGLGDVPWVFCSRSDTPIRRSHFHAYWFKPLLNRAALPSIRFHDLRHTSATLLLSAGVHPKVVQERLGHSQIGVTMDIYSHVLPSMQQEAASKLNEMLGGSAG
jgi:integrase